jgi:hypothetical protein
VVELEDTGAVLTPTHLGAEPRQGDEAVDDALMMTRMSADEALVGAATTATMIEEDPVIGAGVVVAAATDEKLLVGKGKRCLKGRGLEGGPGGYREQDA